MDATCANLCCKKMQHNQRDMIYVGQLSLSETCLLISESSFICAYSAIYTYIYGWMAAIGKQLVAGWGRKWNILASL